MGYTLSFLYEPKGEGSQQSALLCEQVQHRGVVIVLFTVSHLQHDHTLPLPPLLNLSTGGPIFSDALPLDDVIRCRRILSGASLAVLDIDRSLAWLPSSLLRLLDAVSPDDADMLDFVTGEVDRRAYIVIRDEQWDTILSQSFLRFKTAKAITRD